MAKSQQESTMGEDVEAAKPTTKFTDQTSHLPQRQIITVRDVFIETRNWRSD